MNRLTIPDTNTELSDGSIVILAKYPGVKWILHNGWYTYNNQQCMGWYFCSIPSQTILPVTAVDLRLLTVLSNDGSSITEGCLPPCSNMHPHHPPFSNSYPCPGHDTHHVHHPRPPIHPPYIDDPNYTDIDADMLNRAFITVESVAHRNRLDTGLLPHGKLVRVNNVDGKVRYFSWDSVDLVWRDASFEFDDTELRNSISEITESLKSKLDVPSSTIPGAFIIFDEKGNIKSSQLTIDSMNDSIDDIDESIDNITRSIDNITESVDNINESIDATDESINDIKESLNNKMNKLDDIIPGALIVVDHNGNIKCSDLTPEDVQSAIDSKLSIPDDAIPGSLIVVGESGKLESSSFAASDLVLLNNIITGSATVSQKIEVNGQTQIPIPDDVKQYGSMHVYHNGVLLIPTDHYTITNDAIVLIGFSTYSGDTFTFVGYGSTGALPNKGGLTLGETADTAFRGDYGNIAYKHSQEAHAPASSQENVIESVIVGKLPLPVDKKAVTIPVGSLDTAGVVKSSIEENKVFINRDGTMSINSVDVTKLIVPEGEELILYSGDSTA